MQEAPKSLGKNRVEYTETFENVENESLVHDNDRGYLRTDNNV